ELQLKFIERQKLQSIVKTWRSSSNRVVKQAFQFRQQAVEQPVSGEACSVEDVEEFEKSVESSKLLAAYKNVDSVKECCEQVCQDAISEAAAKIAGESVEVSALDAPSPLPRNSTKIGDCKSIVLRWLASKLDHSSAMPSEF
ncbi:Uncharacterized GPI-anchored protein At1g61900, partial [Linum perenne]